MVSSLNRVNLIVVTTDIHTGRSTYCPGWVKKDAKRFPRAKLRKAGSILETADVLSMFHSEGRETDARAFEMLMSHIKEIDESHSTVLMVQVENEVGLLGDCRDGAAAADEAFSKSVPGDLVDFLHKEWDSLHAYFKPKLRYFKDQSNPSSGGSWEAVFGKGAHTD